MIKLIKNEYLLIMYQYCPAKYSSYIQYKCSFPCLQYQALATLHQSCKVPDNINHHLFEMKMKL